MNKPHALLSPSGASRWLACTPSARLEEQFPDRTNKAAKEGTLAHALGELMLRKSINQITFSEFSKNLKKLESDPLYNNAMWADVGDYAEFVLECYATTKAHTKDALLEIEVKLDLTEYIPEGFGTGDAVIIADNTLDLIDMKYGKGVLINAKENKQMMLYALGALELYSSLYAINTVRMTIFQPRLENFSSYEISVADLYSWAETELKPKAALAFGGEGEYNPGEHCRFCRAKAVCKANADYQLQLAKNDFKNPDLLTDDAVSDILTRAASFENWLTSVKEYALNEAVNNNKHWPGYKLVEGRSNRIITDQDAAAGKLTELHYSEEQIWNKKLKGITDLERLLGKKEFSEQLDKWVIKPEGKPTLVPENDKRPELNSQQSAMNDFQNVNIS